MKNIILILALLLASNSVQAQTGSQKSAAALSSEVNALLPTNGQNEINAYSLRQIEQDIIASTIGAGGLPLVLGSTQLLGATQGFVLYDNNGTLGNLSATTTFNGTPCVLGSACSVSTSPQFNAKASPYNATGNGLADDTAALQACITAAEVVGNTCYIPAGQYKTTSALSITSHVSITGDGYQGIGNSCVGTGGACPLLTSSNVGHATTIEPSATNNAFNVVTDDSVSFSNFQIVYLTPPALGSGITAISWFPTTGTMNNGFSSSLQNMMIAQADVGLFVSDVYAWKVKEVNFYNNSSHGIVVSAVNQPAQGDWTISGSQFVGGADGGGTPSYQDHILLQATCGRIIDNKFNNLGESVWPTYGIHVNGTISGANSEPCNFNDNSFEGLDQSIFLDGSSNIGSMSQWTINGNQFWASPQTQNSACIRSTATGSNVQWISNGVISGNYCTITTLQTASFTGSISGTTLTASSGTGIVVGNTVLGSGVTAGTRIVSGSGTSWVVNNSQSVGSEAMTTNVIGTGFLLDGMVTVNITGNTFALDAIGGNKNVLACSFGSYMTNIGFGYNLADISGYVNLDSCGNWSNYSPTVTASSGTITTYSTVSSYHLDGKSLTFSIDVGITTVGSASGNLIIPLPSGMTSYGAYTFSAGNLTTGTSIFGSINNTGSSLTISTVSLADDSYVISGTMQIN